MADNNVAIKLWKNSSDRKRVGINVPQGTTDPGYALYVNGSVVTTSGLVLSKTADLSTNKTLLDLNKAGYYSAIRFHSRAGSETSGGVTRTSSESSTNGRGIIFYFFSYTADNTVTNYAQFRFRHYSPNGDGTQSSYYEDYTLPNANVGRTGNATYSILTSKNTVTVAQGGTGGTTGLEALNSLGTLSFKSAGIHLTSGTNIDTDLVEGTTYYSANSTETQALNGTLPFTGSGMKIIEFQAYSNNYDRQFAFGSTETIYLRRKRDGEWQSWKSLSLSDHSHDLADLSGILPVTQGGTGASSFADASNSLRVWSLGPGTAIPANSNLNTYTTIGNYHCAATANAKTVTNTPIGTSSTAFVLKVCYGTGTSGTYLKQDLKYYDRTQIWQRYSTNGGSSWGDWTVLLKKVGTDAIGNTSTPVYITTDGNPAVISAAIPLTLGGTGATTAANALKNLVGTTAIGSDSLPIYWTGSTFTGVINVVVSATNTSNRYARAENSNGAVDLLASTNRGLYDRTNSAWIIYHHKDNDATYIPKWINKGSVKGPVYFNNNGEPATCNTMTNLLTKTLTGTTITDTLIGGYSNYNYLIVMGWPGNGTEKCCTTVIPTSLLTTSNQQFTMSSGSAGISFYLKRSSNDVIITEFAADYPNTWKIKYVYGGI